MAMRARDRERPGCFRAPARTGMQGAPAPEVPGPEATRESHAAESPHSAGTGRKGRARKIGETGDGPDAPRTGAPGLAARRTADEDGGDQTAADAALDARGGIDGARPGKAGAAYGPADGSGRIRR